MHSRIADHGDDNVAARPKLSGLLPPALKERACRDAGSQFTSGAQVHLSQPWDSAVDSLHHFLQEAQPSGCYKALLSDSVVKCFIILKRASWVDPGSVPYRHEVWVMHGDALALALPSPSRI